MNNLEVYGISEAVLKIALTFAVAVIPSLLVLVAALRAGQGVVTAAKGVLKAIQQQIDTPEEQASVGALLKIPPEYVHEVEEFLKRLQGSSAPVPTGWQAVTVMETPPAAVGVAYVAPPQETITDWSERDIPRHELPPKPAESATKSDDSTGYSPTPDAQTWQIDRERGEP